MKMPRFTAEASLYKTNGHWFTAQVAVYARGGSYGVMATLSGSNRASRVTPRPMGSPVPNRGCNPGCLCVYPEGCPCCESIGSPQQLVGNRALTELTCEPGAEAYCEDWCQHAGGGMSTNPDGSTTCTVYSAL
jgi:hypothetical protein